MSKDAHISINFLRENIMNVSMNEKRAICKRFVIDVLRDRVVKLAKERLLVAQNGIDERITPEIQQAHAVLIAAAKKNEDVANMVGLETEYSFDCDKLVSEVTVNVISLHDWNHGDDTISLHDDDFGITSKLQLRVERNFWTTDSLDLDEVCPIKSMNSTETEFDKRNSKLSKDAGKLYVTSMNAVRKLRTVSSIEDKCPELIPYITEGSGCNGTDLADMASCMRVKENC